MKSKDVNVLCEKRKMNIAIFQTLLYDYFLLLLAPLYFVVGYLMVYNYNIKNTYLFTRKYLKKETVEEETF